MASNTQSATFSYEGFKPSNLFDLTGRTAIVTGGATGIGLAQAQGLTAAGARVYILSRREEVLKDVVAKYGFEGYLAADVTDKASIEGAVKQYEAKEKWLDILVSNAGGPGPTHFGADTSSPEGATDPAKKHEPVSAEEYKKRILDANSFDNWDEIFRLNSHALLFVATAFLPLLAKGSERGMESKVGSQGGQGAGGAEGTAPGRGKKYTATIISTSSISAMVKQSQMHYAYNASKAACAHLTDAIAYELTYSTTARVRVNSVAPGVFPSQMTTDWHRDEQTSKSDLDAKLPVMSIPAQRHGHDEDMASIIQFLAANEYMHGQVVPLDGGFSMSEP